jgi:uncharacterized membrane protein YraQ (UPF0718 family)
MDPLMTVARPVSAFIAAITAGITENLLHPPVPQFVMQPDLSCLVDNCCSGKDCSAEEHARHHTFFEKLKAGTRFALFDVWEDLAVWFTAGLILAGVVTVLVPEATMVRYLSGGPWSLLIMLAVGIPIYICATASTPIAAALILKGVSPGAALVFLLAGPATNITALSTIMGILGKRATAIYLFTLSLCALLCGLALDYIYIWLNISAQATVGNSAQIIPYPIQFLSALILIFFSIKPLYVWLRGHFSVKSLP